MNKPKPDKHVDNKTRVMVTREEGAGKRAKGVKGGQLFGVGYKLVFCMVNTLFTEVEIQCYTGET